MVGVGEVKKTLGGCARLAGAEGGTIRSTPAVLYTVDFKLRLNP